MLQRHKVPTIFNIYMLDVVCCAVGCVVLLWQVAHQEAEQQTADAKESHAEAGKQSDAAVRARLQYEKAQQELLSASNDVTYLQAQLADWQKKHQTLTQGLTASEQDRDKARAAWNLSAAQLKKLDADLAKLLGEQKKTTADLAGAKVINVDLLAQNHVTQGRDRERRQEGDGAIGRLDAVRGKRTQAAKAARFVDGGQQRSAGEAEAGGLATQDARAGSRPRTQGARGLLDCQG